MAEYGKVQARSAKAAADLTAQQFHFLQNDAAGTVNVSSGGSGGAATIVGILQNKPSANQAATVGWLGESKVVAGGSVSANVWITSNGSGRATAAGSGDLVAGYAVEAAGADGEQIRAVIGQPWRLTGSV